MSKYSYEDFTGNTYPIRKRILVTIFSQTDPYSTGKISIKGKGKFLTDSQLDVDAEYLKTVFKKIHHPEMAVVSVLNGKTKAEVSEYMKELDKKEENFNYDIFIFVFLTFMSFTNTKNSLYRDERIHLKDGLFPMQEIYDEAKKSEVMLMKPKIFLIQSDDLSLCYERDHLKGPEQVIEKKIPQDADRLIIMSDIPQMLANLDENTAAKNPSFLIEAFGETLMENSGCSVEQRLDLFSLTPIINQKVLQRIDKIERAEDLSAPLVTSTLTKLVKI